MSENIKPPKSFSDTCDLALWAQLEQAFKQRSDPDKRPAGLPFGAWIADLMDYDSEGSILGLMPDELEFVRCVMRGQPAVFSEERPEPDDETAATLRANLVRCLVLGTRNSFTVPDLGIMLFGARLLGKLDLRGVKAKHLQMALSYCHFVKKPNFTNAHFHKLSLVGSSLKGVDASSLKLYGSLLMQRVESERCLNFVGAEIGGQFSCSATSLSSPGGTALQCNALSVGRDVIFFGEAGGAQIQGDLDFTCANIDGGLRFEMGQISSAGSLGLCLESASIGEGLSFSGESGSATLNCKLNLRHAKVRTLGISKEAWPDKGNLQLHGFEFQQFSADTPQSKQDLIDWLDLQPAPEHSSKFSVQPWHQIIKVMQKNGARERARALMRELERRMNQHERSDHTGVSRYLFSHFAYVFWGFLFGWGYGVRRTLLSLALILLAGWWTHQNSHQSGLIAPASSVMMTNAQIYHSCRGNWSGEACTLPEAYTSFNALMYSLDVMLPLVSLGQETAWGPVLAPYQADGNAYVQTSKSLWRFGLHYVQMILGWIYSVIFVVIVTRWFSHKAEAKID